MLLSHPRSAAAGCDTRFARRKAQGHDDGRKDLAMKEFLKKLQTLPEVSELLRRIEGGGCPAAVTGLQPVQRSCVGAAVGAAAAGSAVFLCGDEREARQLAADLRSLTGEEATLLLSREWQLRPIAVASREWERSRLSALHAMACGQTKLVIATADALMARTMSPDLLMKLTVELCVGGQYDLKELAETLLAAGYARCEQVEGPGQFALRGGILDVYSPLLPQPVRCEFFDDEVDAMGTFDPGTQRRTAHIERALLLPAAEVLPGCAKGGLAGLGERLMTLGSRLMKKERSAQQAQRLLEDGEKLKSGLIAAASEYGYDLHVTGVSSLFYLRLADDPSLMLHQRWIAECVKRGAYLTNHHNHFINAALTDADIAETVEIAKEAFAAIGS